MHGATDLGRIFFFAEFAMAVAGWVLGINPFDQPNVQEAKDNTAKVLDGTRPGQLPEVADADEDALRALLSDAGAAALRGDPGLPRAVRRRSTPRWPSCARRIRATTRRGDDVRLRPALPALDRPAAQGRPARPVCFLQLVHDQRRGRRDPGRGILVPDAEARGQATGDLQTLRDHGLPAERVTLEGDAVDALHELTAKIEAL